MIDLIEMLLEKKKNIRPLAVSVHEIQKHRKTDLKTTENELNNLVKEKKIFFYRNVNKIPFFYFDERKLI